MSANIETAAARAILVKEWLKLKWALPVLGASVVLLLLWFWWSLDISFHQTEPQAMLWYHAAQLGEKPYAVLVRFYLLTATIVAVCQALPEIIRNRIRILIHLPIPLTLTIRLHLLIGVAAILVVNGIAGGVVSLIVAAWYPDPIVASTIRDALFWLVPALIWYLGLWAVIIEQRPVVRIVKFFPVVAATLLAVKGGFQLLDVWIPVALVIIIVMIGDSFLSTKGQRLTHPGYRVGIIGLYLVTVLLGVQHYRATYANDRHDYYIFYSPLLNTFVYQHNLGGHRFRYGSTETDFTRQDYEAALPFIFWRDLDIVGKLPIDINGRLFSADDIREYRLSIPYHPRDLHPSPIALYPFFNPSSRRGMLPFPNQAIVPSGEGFIVYNGDDDSTAVDHELTTQINTALAEAGVAPPVVRIWGRTTSMKPFDWGYFIKDWQGNIFNLRRMDDRVTVTPLVTNRDIVHMQMAENRQMELYGFAITADNALFMIRYPDFKLIPLMLDGFDRTRMRFQLLGDPLHYLLRYDDGTAYHAVLFDRHWQRLAEVVLK